MRRIHLLFLSLFLLGSTAVADDDDIRYNSLIKLPADDEEKHALLSSLDGFLRDMAAERKTEYVDPDHYAANSLFFGGLEGHAASVRYTDDAFYKSHLLDARPLGEGEYLLKVALIGDPPEDSAVVLMVFRMRAIRNGSRFEFRSLLEENRAGCQRKSIGNIDYRFEGTLDEARARKFDEFNTMMAHKLDMQPQRVDYTHCRNTDEALAFLGIDYYVLANGSARGFATNNGFEFLTGFNEEGYEHDLLHVYFEQKFDGDETYRAFEEGIATFYAGSWGDSYESIVAQLTEYVRSQPDLDLRSAYEEHPRIGHHDFRFMVNALLVEELEREGGFDTVIDVLHCGGKGEQYWEKLQKHLGLTEDAFNASVRQKLAMRS